MTLAGTTAEKPSSTRVKLSVGWTMMPWSARRETSSRWADATTFVHASSCSMSTAPPAAATRSPSDGVLSTTMTRRPSDTRGREPTRPCHDCAEEDANDGACAPLPPAASSAAVAAAARTARTAAYPASARGVRIEAEVRRIGERSRETPGRRDHRRVVGAELERRQRGVGKRGTQLRVRRDAADDRDARRPELRRSLAHAPDERADDGVLIRRSEIGPPSFELARGQVTGRVQQRGLQPGEGEVSPRNARDRKVVGLGVAVPREPVDLAAARIAEAEQPRALVERLPGRIVQRRPEHVLLVVPAHVEEQRVAAAREQAQERRLNSVRLEVERGDMAAEMIDRHEREPARPRDRLGRREPDEQRTDEAGPLRDGDLLDVIERRARVRQRLAHDGGDELEMPPRGDLRDDAAEAGVQLGL